MMMGDLIFWAWKQMKKMKEEQKNRKKNALERRSVGIIRYPSIPIFAFGFCEVGNFGSRSFGGGWWGEVACLPMNECGMKMKG